MREILDTLCSKNVAAAVSLGKKSFTTKIGEDDCEFWFHEYQPHDSIINPPSNWEKYKR